MSMNFGINLFSQPAPTTSTLAMENTAGSSTTDADLKEYKSLLDKQSKGMLSTRDQSRLNELKTNLSKSGKVNRDGSVKSGRNSDRLKINARRMSWDEVAESWGFSKPQGVSNRAANIVRGTAQKAISQQMRQPSGMMSKNGSIFGNRRI